MKPSLQRWRTNATDWWAGRNSREQLLLGGLAAVTAATILMNGVWRPLQSARGEARESIRISDAVAAQFRAAGPDRLRQAYLERSPTAVITESAASAGVSIRQLEPTPSGARLVLEDVEFTRLLAFLAQVERDGRLRPSQMKVERRPAPGVVTARLSLGA